MIRLIDVIGTNVKPCLWQERKVGDQLGYYKILAIDYVNKNVLFNYLHISGFPIQMHFRMLVDLNEHNHLKKFFKWIDA